MKNYITPLYLFLLLAFYSCSPIIAVNLTPQTDFGDEDLIKDKYLSKTHLVRFNVLKDKSKRAKYFNTISKLSNEGLDLYRNGKFPVDKYSEFALFSQLGSIIITQLVLEENNLDAHSDIASKLLNEATKLKVIYTRKETENSDVEFAIGITIFVMDNLLAPYRN